MELILRPLLKYVTKSISPCRTTAKRVELPIKITQLSASKREGVVHHSEQDTTSRNQERKSRRNPLNR